MKTIIIATGGWLLGLVILANCAMVLRPSTVRAQSAPWPSSEERIRSLELRVAQQQEYIDDHTSALAPAETMHVFRPGDDISVSDSRAMSQAIPRSFWRRH